MRRLGTTFVQWTVLVVLLLDWVSGWKLTTANHLDANRRAMLTSIVLATPTAAGASTAATPAEAIRRSAANIPGFGPSDVFFPSVFLGKWNMKREILGGEEPLLLNYPIRFLPSIEETSVVADRGFNQAGLENALYQLRFGSNEKTAVASYEWTETNPNDLRLVMADGSRKEIKVTKRSAEKTDEMVSSSEFQRVVQENARGIPVVSARRVLTKWIVFDTTRIEGLELVYDVGGGDPFSTGLSAGKDPSQPKLLTKSRLKLKRYL